MIPSSAVVYTGQSGGNGTNQGFGAILDQHPDFLPYAQRIYENKRAEDVKKAAQEREAAKEFQKVLKGPDLGAVPLRAQQQIQEGLTKYKQLALDMGTGKIKGKDGRKLNPLDPYDLEAASLLQAEELKLKSLKAAADNQDAYIMKALEASKDPKYSKKHLTERLGELKNAKTIEDVEAWMEVNPLKVNRGTIDIVHDLAPKLYTAISETGNKTTLTEAITKDNVDVLVEDHLNTEQGMEDFEAGVIEGRWKDEEGMKEAIYKSAAAQNPGKKSTTFDEPRVSQGGGSGGGNSNKFSFSESTITDNTGLIQDGLPNQGYVTRVGTNDNLPAIGVRDDNGNLIDWQFSGNYVVGPDGNIGLEGFKSVKGQTVPYPANGSQEEKMQWAMTMGKTPAEMKPTWIDLNRNENAMKSVLMGVDLYDRLGRKKPSKGGQPKPQETEKVATMSEVRAMLKQSPGYTEQELVDYYKSQGYTIKE